MQDGPDEGRKAEAYLPKPGFMVFIEYGGQKVKSGGISVESACTQRRRRCAHAFYTAVCTAVKDYSRMCVGSGGQYPHFLT